MKQPPWPKPAEYLQKHPDPDGLLFYPGAWTDYGPLRLFAENGRYARAAYCDYGMSREDAFAFMTRIPGWQVTAGPFDLDPSEYGASDWADLWPDDDYARSHRPPGGPFGLRTRLANEAGLVLTVDYLGTEGIATYHRLCAMQRPPTALVLQDHGFGSNWASFGGTNGFQAFATLAIGPFPFGAAAGLPPIAFTAQDTSPWPGYFRVTRYLGYVGAMHKDKRAVFTRDTDLDRD